MAAVTFGALKSKILREVNKPSSKYLVDIGEAIVTALRFWDNKPVFFNETITTLTLLTGTNSVALPLDFKRLERVQILVNNRYRGAPQGFKLVDFSKMWDDWLDPTRSDVPVECAILNGVLYFNCLSNGDYTLRLQYNYGDTTYPVNDGDTSVWFDVGQDIIRCEAKSVFYADRLHDYEKAAACKAQADNFYDGLLIRSNNAQSEWTLNA